MLLKREMRSVKCETFSESFQLTHFKEINSKILRKVKNKWQYLRKEQDIPHKGTEDQNGKQQNLKQQNVQNAVQ